MSSNVRINEAFIVQTYFLVLSLSNFEDERVELVSVESDTVVAVLTVDIIIKATLQEILDDISN